MKRRIRYAVVGLGHIAQVAVLPAFAHARNSELAALITGDPKKAEQLAVKYGADRKNCEAGPSRSWRRSIGCRIGAGYPAERLVEQIDKAEDEAREER